MKRSFIISKNTKLNLGSKGVGIDFGEMGLEYALSSIKMKNDNNFNKKKLNKFNTISNEQETGELNKELNVDTYNKLLKLIVTVHKRGQEIIEWQKINSTEPPYDFSNVGPNEQNAIKKYEEFKETFLERIIKSLGKKKRIHLFNMIQEAKKIDKEIYSQWENLNMLSKKVIEGDIDAYFQVIDEMNSFNELLSYGSEFEVGTNDGSAIEVEFRVKSSNVIPISGPYKNGKPCGERMSKRKYYDLVQDYACSGAIRISRDIMALIPVEKVIVHAVDTIKDDEANENYDITILSVVFDKETFETLKFDTIDPSLSLRNFLCNMKQQKTTGLEPVSRIIYY